MQPFTRQQGSWTIRHVPAGHSAYDRVLGRLTAWSLEVEHTSGWIMVEYEGAGTAQIFAPDGLLVGDVDPDAFAPGYRPSLTTGRSALLIEALTTWTQAHAADFDEPAID